MIIDAQRMAEGSGAGVATRPPPSTRPPLGAGREFDLTSQDFDALRALVLEHTGITLNDTKSELLYGRLGKRLRALGLKHFREYCTLLESGDAQELLQFVSAVTTNTTSFRRESHHFDFLTGTLVPLWRERSARPARRIRVWSAGCSTGQEPYDIAVLLHEATRAAAGAWDIKILATDIDDGVLSRCEEGLYPESDLDAATQEQKRLGFLRGSGPNAGMALVRPEVKELVTFRKLNLMGPWPVRGPFDAIFCRNVLIYFDDETKLSLVRRFARLLGPDGHLFLGHSESMAGVKSDLVTVGPTTYRHGR